MKQIITFLIILLPFSLFSQIYETFEGPEITSTYSWQGDLNEFYLSGDQQLIFDSPPGEAGEALLYLRNIPYFASMVWEMEIMFDFKPTNSNNCRVEVYTSTLQNVTEKYYIQIGNNNGQISLYRQDTGNPVVCIGGRRSLMDIPYAKVYIRLTLSQNEEWTLQTRTVHETAYVTEGVYKRKILNPVSNGIFTLICRYIKSRYSAFYFDTISTTSSSSEVPPPSGSFPEIEEIRFPQISQMELVYSLPVQIDNASVIITDMGEAERIEYGKTYQNILCFFPFALSKSGTYEIEIRGFKTTEGADIPEEFWELEFEEEPDIPLPPVPEPPPVNIYAPGCVLINEVMANPKGLVELPETEYIELYNCTSESISLKDWVLYYGNQKVVLPEKVLIGGQYVVLFREGRSMHVDPDGIGLPLPNFPAALSNNGKELALHAPDGIVIDETVYDKATAAKSWERYGTKWYLSQDVRGGTPGSVNTYTGNPAEPSPSDIEVQPGDIVFNELLPNPYPEASEFIEFYNRSASSLSVTGLAVAIRRPDDTLATHYPLKDITYTLPEEGYLVITKDKSGLLPFYTIEEESVIVEVKMPVLNNSTATLVLFRTEDGTVIDEISYSSKWHSSGIISEKGVSLERIDPDGITQDEKTGLLPQQLPDMQLPVTGIRNF
ncbi:MAG: lamin tail domain-containing protein [Tannerellaceae bacterium]|nr:lamin tail domain-containing protein [Tannerellaceae bacterium]